MSQPQSNPNATVSLVPEVAAASALSANEETVTVAHTPVGEPVEMPRFAPATQPGELGRLGKYRIQKELGRGGMGAVYLAFDERLQRKIALKVMLPKAAANATAKDRFLREARAAAQISSDHVVNIHEADEIDGTPYIALQFLQGYPLDEYLNKQGSPSLPQIIKIGQETAIGLEAAHQLGLVHRDIKPGNLWLEAPHGRVKILDFGLARQQDDDVHLTRSGAVVGTPAYMSPEQGRGVGVDHRSDLFSLGGVLYRLCTGRLPFKGDSTMALLMAIGIDEPTPVRELNPGVPEPLANLIHRLLAKDPANRPPSAQAVADELATMSQLAAGQVVAGLPVVYLPMDISVQESNPFEGIVDPSSATSQSVTQADVEDAPPPRKPFPKMLVASLLFAVLVVAGAVFLLTKKPPTDVANKDPEPTPTPIVTPKKVEPVKDPERSSTKFALEFDGNGEVRIPTPLPYSPESCTVEAYVRVDSPTTRGIIFGFDGSSGLFLELDSGNTWRFSHVQQPGGHFSVREVRPGSMNVEFGRRSHVAGVYAPDKFSLFVDGKLVGRSPSITKQTFTPSKNRNLIGMRLQGAIDEVRISSKVRYSVDFTPPVRHSSDADTLALYRFDEGQGDTLKDSSGNGHHGTITGAKWVKIAAPGADPDRAAAEYVLSIGGTVRVNGEDRDIKAIDQLPKGPFRLAAVGLAMNKQVTDAGLAVFKDCPDVTRLDLRLTPITNAGLSHFHNCKKLTQLQLHQTAVNDAGLVTFKGCTDITHLQLSHTGTTDAGLANFKECKALTFLDARRTKVTAKGLEEFQAACPLCRIEWDGGTIEPKQ